METTFITIHNLTEEALILYSSDSIIDVLGHTPDEVVNKSTWDFFKPTEVADAQRVHVRSVTMDKASVLIYCDIKNARGEWVRCECCFSIVYDVMVACTSIYRHDLSGVNRRVKAPIVRRLFSSSPKDPRYHMLQHLSTKFNQDSGAQSHEPRAALFLNRFTRTLTIMYATSGIEEIIGISGEDMKGRSFYYCIAEACLEDAIQCLESAKGNDSIAYLRFMFRDPRQDDDPLDETATITTDDHTDAEMTDVRASESEVEASLQSTEPDSGSGMEGILAGTTVPASSNNSVGGYTSGSGQPAVGTSQSADFTSPSASEGTSGVSPPNVMIELEAVVSCTSDGLVVCLRRARPTVPDAIQNTTRHPESSGFFAAAPWAQQPAYLPHAPAALGGTFAGVPPNYGGLLLDPPQPGPDPTSFLQAVREVAVFAWGLTGINGSLVDYARGTPSADSQPHGGLPIWDPTHKEDTGYSSGRGSVVSEVLPEA